MGWCHCVSVSPSNVLQEGRGRQKCCTVLVPFPQHSHVLEIMPHEIVVFGPTRFNTAPSFTINCHFPDCRDFLDESCVPNRDSCSTTSPQCYPELAKDALLVQENMKPLTVVGPTSFSWVFLLCHLIPLLSSVHFASQIHFSDLYASVPSAPLFFSFLADLGNWNWMIFKVHSHPSRSVIFAGISLPGPGPGSTLNVSSCSPLDVSSYSNHICQMEQLFSLSSYYPASTSHAHLALNYFPAPKIQLEFGHSLSLGMSVGFLELILSHKGKVQTWLCWVKPPVSAGQNADHCSWVHLWFGWESSRWHLGWAESSPVGLGDKGCGAVCTAGWECAFVPSLCLD